jgi:tetratricopeptide (TPR) repeat protein|tara:strand:+ start:2218 stop:2670 length:453 start_codon:yes stop_codon:yes gene_type:complete
VHEKEIQYFAEAFQLANDKFYIDAIHQFNKLVAEFPDSDLSDDALLNIGLCYYSMSQFEKSIESLNHVIQLYPDATISTLNDSNEYGKTAAKAYYLIVQCYIGLGDIEKAKTYIPIIDGYNGTYVVTEDGNSSFSELAEKAIQLYVSIKK